MNKKLLTVLLVVVLLVTAVISGTMAYFTDSDYVENVMTLGNVDIAIDEEYTQDSPLYPVVPEEGKDPSEWENYVDKIVNVKNEGDSDAYVRVQLAVPASLDDNGAIHLDVNDTYWTQEEGCTQLVEEGITYNLYTYTYNEILPAGDSASTKEPVLSGVYLDSKVDYDAETGEYFITDGVDKVVLEGMNDDNDVSVLVYAQAVQAAGFDNAADAFAAANFPVPGAPEAQVVKADDLTIEGHKYDLTAGPSSWQGCKDDTIDEFTLDCAYVFTAPDDATTVQDNPYRYWNADYVVTVDQDLDANVATLAGQYDSFDDHWLIIPVNFSVEAGEEYRLLEGTSGITMTYEELCKYVKVFQCGAEATDAAEGVTLTVELRLFETINADTDSGNHVDETGRSITIGTYSYTF